MCASQTPSPESEPPLPKLRRRTPESARRVTVTDIAVELGLSVFHTKRLLRVHGWWLPTKRRSSRGRCVTYDASVIETLRALYDQPHREAEPPERDWLARYIERGKP